MLEACPHAKLHHWSVKCSAGSAVLTTAVSYLHSCQFWLHYSHSFQGSTVLILSEKCIFYKCVFVTTHCCRVRLTHQHNSGVSCVMLGVQLTGDNAIKIAGHKGDELQYSSPLGWDRWKKLNAEKHPGTPTNKACTTALSLKHLANSCLGKQGSYQSNTTTTKNMFNTFLVKVMAKAAIHLSVEAAFSKTSEGLIIQPPHAGNWRQLLVNYHLAIKVLNELPAQDGWNLEPDLLTS